MAGEYWEDYFSGPTAGRAYGWGKFFDETTRRKRPGEMNAKEVREDREQLKRVMKELWDQLPETDPAWDLMNPQSKAYYGEGGWGQKGKYGTPEEWVQMLNVTRDLNQRSIDAGQKPEFPQYGYLMGQSQKEALEQAQKVALRNAWEDQMSKMMPGFNPHAQTATSFAPNQFSATDNVYVDPFQDEGPLGVLRDKVRFSSHPIATVPGMVDELGIPTEGATVSAPGGWGYGQEVKPYEQMPETPGSLKSMVAQIEKMKKDQQGYVEKDMATRQAALQKQREAAQARIQKIMDRVEKGEREAFKADMNYTKGVFSRKVLDQLTRAARIEGHPLYEKILEANAGNVEAANKKYADMLLAKYIPGYAEAKLGAARAAEASSAKATPDYTMSPQQIKLEQQRAREMYQQPIVDVAKQALGEFPREPLGTFKQEGPKYPPGEELWPGGSLQSVLQFLSAMGAAPGDVVNYLRSNQR